MRGICICSLVAVGLWSNASSASDDNIDVLTYHNTPLRTGWNASETILTPEKVKTDFGWITTVVLQNENDQVDAQPLVVTNQMIEGAGIHTVVYVATENNSIYAIDGGSGAILKKADLGTPVPMPLKCGNNGPTVGINSTPTIELDTRTLYVVDYVLLNSVPTHRLHALDLATLKDKPNSPVVIAGNSTLEDGSSIQFDSSVQRQRAALLQKNGRIYVGFAAFCDFKAARSRGWVLGFDQTTLQPVTATLLLNKQTTAPTNFNCYFEPPDVGNHPCFLTSVWMSGFGIAADDEGNLFFTTGNTARGIYNEKTNLAESLVKLSPDLSNVLDYFTPADLDDLDRRDRDFGSGGALVLPDQPGPSPHLVVAAGKAGELFVVNRDPGRMGRFHNPNLSASVSIGGECWCGPSYFKGADGVGRIVSSGDSQVKQWTVQPGTVPTLSLEASAPPLDPTGQSGGFFTSISSDGTQANTAIIWAVGRPASDKPYPIKLYAFNGSASNNALEPLGSWNAGTWPHTGGNANLVATVANGKVYVASYRQLQIFGPRPPGALMARAERAVVPAPVAAPEVFPATGPLYWGTIREVDGSVVKLELRDGRVLSVDVSRIMPMATAEFGDVGRALAVTGSFASNGVLVADGLWRAKGMSLWGPDRSK